MKCFSSRISVWHIRHVGTSHNILVTLTVTKGDLGSKPNFFFKIFICNTLLQLFTTSRIITVASTVVLFCFQGRLWGGFTSTKFFVSVASSETLIQRCFLMKYGTSIGEFSFKIVLNIFEKFLKNISDRAHVQHSYELSICALS